MCAPCGDRFRRRWNVAVCGGLLTIATVTSPSPGQIAPEALDRQIKASFSVDRYDLQQLHPVAGAGGSLQTVVRLGDEDVRLELAPHASRAADFRLYTRDGEGRLTPIVAPPTTTYRGGLAGRPGARATGSFHRGRLHALIEFDGETWAVQPLADDAGLAGDPRSIVFRKSDAAPGDWACGVEDAPAGKMPAPVDRRASSGLSCENLAEIAFETDFEYYQLNNSDVTDTLADLEMILNEVNAIYERDVFITHVLTTVVLQTDIFDPYDGADSLSRLNQFRDHWNANHSPGSGDPIDRDIAHFMTGFNLAGVAVGRAWLAAICDSLFFGLGYGISETLFTANLILRVQLTAHELGHNWNADHCDGDTDCAIMCSVIAACSGDSESFGLTSRTDIGVFRDASTCVETGGTPPDPDCNINCIADADEISGGTSQDCNLNGVPDSCDITSGLSGDCDANGVPDICEDCDLDGVADACQLSSVFDDSSPLFTPFGLDFPPADATHTIVSPPTPVGDVTFTFTANAPLNGANEVVVTINGAFFGPNPGTGQIFGLGESCGTPSVEVIVMTAAEFLAFTGGGDAVIHMDTTDFLATDCGGATSIQVDVGYVADLMLDTNMNGLLDVCECDEDCSGAPDGNVGIEEFLAVLANWGASTTCDFAPAGGDGTVGIEEFLGVLASWGACFTP